MTHGNPLIRALQDPALYDHDIREFQLVETHISWVLLTGPYAYKIKKPVDLGFLDFSSLAKRRHFCEEELRLNRRLAPDLYLAVLPVYGSATAPRFNPDGEAIEYLVKMRQFPQEAQLDRVLERRALEPGHILQLADTVARFHAGIAVAAPGSPYGEPARIEAPCMENFDQVEARLRDPGDTRQLEALRDWTRQAFDRLQARMAQRKADGFVRECHGDLHLRNIALLDATLQVFDCIEFNDDFRWIDVLSEVAFTMMDLTSRARADYAWLFLNRYLEHSGDYTGLALLRYYLVYRAMVRAKVDCIRASQPDLDAQEQGEVLAEYRRYVQLAEHYTRRARPVLFITHGLSGSGKTYFSTQILMQAALTDTGVIRIRSDIERKRLFGLPAEAHSDSAVAAGIYTADASQRTYAQLLQQARAILDAGCNAIVDATFLRRAQRTHFYELADELGLDCIILDCRAPEHVLRDRIRSRQQAQDASEATLAVLEHQLQAAEPLDADEQWRALMLDTQQAFAAGEFARQLATRLARG